MTKEIKIKYFDKDMPKLEKIAIGDWIDLRCKEDIDLKQGELAYIKLGVAMELPKGYEAIVTPRSSTPKNFGLICANSFGVIDETYCGDNDEWCFVAYAIRDTHIEKYSRICQFRIVEHQPEVKFVELEELGNSNRNGFGSSGIK